MTRAMLLAGLVLCAPIGAMAQDAPALPEMPALSVAPGSMGQVASAPGGAVLRGLDKLTGAVADMVLGPDDAAQFGRLEIVLRECRFPVDNPAADAFAHLTIRDTREAAPLFSGWMLASSPALNALDHPRYDVWVLRCNRV